MKNFLTAFVIYYFSVYLILDALKNKEEEEQDKNELGMFALEDFDVAVKNKNVFKHYRKYVIENPNHY
tara:strand:- start:1076 stop:1279 length:204 start_codon:yes stop_codon:yes gene_type:complete